MKVSQDRRWAWVGLLAVHLHQPAWSQPAKAPVPPAAGATNAPAVQVDESKLPEWVKKQAQSPYKWIIQNDTKSQAKSAQPAKIEKGLPERSANPRVAVPSDGGRASQSMPAPLSGNDTEEGVLPVATSPAPTAATPAASASAIAPGATPTAALAPSMPPVSSPAPVAPRAVPSEEELVPVRQSAPAIPANLADSGLTEGRAVVRFTVNVDGSTSHASIVESSDKQINRYVLAAVKEWLYRPIKKPQLKTVAFVFKLD